MATAVSLGGHALRTGLTAVSWRLFSSLHDELLSPGKHLDEQIEAIYQDSEPCRRSAAVVTGRLQRPPHDYGSSACRMYVK